MHFETQRQTKADSIYNTRNVHICGAHRHGSGTHCQFVACTAPIAPRRTIAAPHCTSPRRQDCHTLLSAGEMGPCKARHGQISVYEYERSRPLLCHGTEEGREEGEEGGHVRGPQCGERLRDRLRLISAPAATTDMSKYGAQRLSMGRSRSSRIRGLMVVGTPSELDQIVPCDPTE